MGVALEQLDAAAFASELAPWTTHEPLIGRLHAHYQELCRWSPRLALIGEGTATEVVARHYGESLLPSGWLPSAGTLVDFGSGAGFPGLIAAATVPELEVVLVEARLRKAAFLRAAARRMGVQVRVHEGWIGPGRSAKDRAGGARSHCPLGDGIPEAIDCVTARAIRFEEPVWAAIAARLTRRGSLLLWVGEQRPNVPALVVDAELPIPGAAHRKIVRWRQP